MSHRKAALLGFTMNMLENKWQTNESNEWFGPFQSGVYLDPPITYLPSAWRIYSFCETCFCAKFGKLQNYIQNYECLISKILKKNNFNICPDINKCCWICWSVWEMLRRTVKRLGHKKDKPQCLSIIDYILYEKSGWKQCSCAGGII